MICIMTTWWCSLHKAVRYIGVSVSFTHETGNGLILSTSAEIWWSIPPSAPDLYGGTEAEQPLCLIALQEITWPDYKIEMLQTQTLHGLIIKEREQQQLYDPKDVISCVIYALHIMYLIYCSPVYKPQKKKNKRSSSCSSLDDCMRPVIL